MKTLFELFGTNAEDEICTTVALDLAATERERALARLLCEAREQCRYYEEVYEGEPP